MTFSIVAVDLLTGEVGAAVASKFLAVGNIVPWVAAGSGAVATQALCNATLGSDGLQLLGSEPAPDVLAKLLGRDARPERRQVGMVDARSGAASHTGSGCQPWAGHRTGAGFACQGNCLTGPEVIDDMAATFESATGPLQARLFAALAAGDRAGGDRRGRQSAALKVLRKGAGYQGLSDTVLDLRVDDHTDPIGELQRLIALHNLYFPSGEAERVALDGAVLEELKAMIRQSGLALEDASGWTPAVQSAIDTFIGNENLEERVNLDERSIDRVALDYLRSARLSPRHPAGVR